MCGAQAEDQSSWSSCKSQDCTGIRLPGQEFCLAHVEEAARAAFLAGLQPGSDLDLRGTPISPDLLTAVLDALKKKQTRKLLRRYGPSQTMIGIARFDGAQFSGAAEFREAQFGGRTWFGEAQFSGAATLIRAQFGGDAEFREALFSGDALFFGSELRGVATFIRAQFSGDVGFDRAQFSRDADFGGAQLSAARVLGPLIVEGQLSLSRASFAAPIVIAVATSQLSLLGVDFQEAATLRVRFAEIALDGTSFAKPSTISFAETAFQTHTNNAVIVIGDAEIEAMRRGLEASSRDYVEVHLKAEDSSGQHDEPRSLETGNREPRPRLLSLRLVDVSNLVLGNLDLSACLFQGAHNLENLRIEGPLRFGLTPGAWRVRVGPSWIPFWRPCVRRQTLAEEHQSRVQQSRPRVEGVSNRFQAPGWSPPPAQKVDWVEKTTGQQVQILSQENLATLYRALRKGLEDQKNAPAAADFYYGEMEMRRHSPTSPWTDRFVLWAYWLFSGYGLRASRALLAFALLVPLFAIGFWLWGLSPPPKGQPPIGYPTALLRSFESATSLLRPAPTGLNEFGQLLDAFLRLIGATLLGLALFSLRGRIKR